MVQTIFLFGDDYVINKDNNTKLYGDSHNNNQT